MLQEFEKQRDLNNSSTHWKHQVINHSRITAGYLAKYSQVWFQLFFFLVFLLPLLVIHPHQFPKFWGTGEGLVHRTDRCIYISFISFEMNLFGENLKQDSNRIQLKQVFVARYVQVMQHYFTSVQTLSKSYFSKQMYAWTCSFWGLEMECDCQEVTNIF